MHTITPIEEAIFVQYKPSVLYFVLAAVLVASTFFSANGLLHLVWGRRLQFSPRFWRNFTIAFACLMLVLAIVNIIVANIVTLESWLKYKSFVPLVSEIVFCCVLPVLLNRSSSLNNAK
jgi:intracellular septation protein